MNNLVLFSPMEPPWNKVRWLACRSLTFNVIPASAEADKLDAWLLRKQLGLRPLTIQEVTLPCRVYAVWSVSSSIKAERCRSWKAGSWRLGGQRSGDQKMRESKRSGLESKSRDLRLRGRNLSCKINK